MSDPKASEQPNASTFSGGLELVSRLVTLVTSVAILLSVIYNWAYFTAISRNTLQLLTISDHVRSALVWFPNAILLLVVTLAYTRLTVSFTRRPITDTRRNLVRFLALVTLAGVIMSFVFPWTTTVGAVVVMGWGWVGWEYLSRWSVSWPVRALVWSAPAGCAVALLFGYSFAVRDMRLQTGDTSIKLKDGGSIENVIVLRYLEKGVLLRVPGSDRIRLLPWDGITEFSAGTRSQWDETPYLCAWFRVGCSYLSAI